MPYLIHKDVDTSHKGRISVVDHAATGAFFRRSRKRARLTQKQVARAAGLHIHKYRQLEAGGATWTEELADRIAKIIVASAQPTPERPQPPSSGT